MESWSVVCGRHPGLADDNKRGEATQSRDETSGAPPGERERETGIGTSTERAPHPWLVVTTAEIIVM